MEHDEKPTALLAAIVWDDADLVPCVAQQHDTGEILMMAWMSRAAVLETLATGRVCYYSRSRKGLWRKGETSGQQQNLVALRLDCDGDALLALVDQRGVACHTGRWSCFSWEARDDTWREIATPRVDPATLYGS